MKLKALTAIAFLVALLISLTVKSPTNYIIWVILAAGIITALTIRGINWKRNQ